MADEKLATTIPPPLLSSSSTTSSTSTLSGDGSWLSGVKNLYNAFHQRREALGLTNPGSMESVGKDVQRDVFVSNGMFTGLRADIQKAFSITPMFHTAHAFSMGSQQLPPYTFMSTYGTPKVFLQATLDNDLSLNARANYRWSQSLTTKTLAQITPASSASASPFSPGAGMGSTTIQIDNDYTGRDFSASLKALNPSLLDGVPTGIFIGSYLQSLTSSFALGVESVWQRPSASSGPESAVSYVAKYKGFDWTASASLHAQGAMSATYWRKLGEKLEVGTEVNVAIQPREQALMRGGRQREGSATVGAKYDFRTASFRAQADSQGKLSMLVEKRLLQAIQITFAGEVDQLKQQASVGVGVSIEIPNEELMEQQEKALSAGVEAPPY